MHGSSSSIDVEMAIPTRASISTEPAQPEAHGVLRLTVDVPLSSRPPNASPPRQSRWRTPEFVVYYVLILLAFIPAISAVVELSNSGHRNYARYARRLSSGWILGRRVDNSDHQYRTFRNNLVVLTGLAGIYLLVRTLYNKLSRNPNRVSFLVVFIAAMQIGLHGFSSLKVLFIILGNYLLGRVLHNTRALPIATWAFNLAVMFGNEIYDGYRFGSLHPALAAFDSINGAYPRWHVTFNFTTLRLISFNMDWYWAARRVEPHEPLQTGSEMNDKQRISTSHDLATYSSFANYYAYVLYPPCYIAGPIMSFNDFLWQVKRPLRIAARDVIAYAVRFIICLLTMEVILHYMYVVAIKDSKAWEGNSPAQLCMLGFWNLIVVWLKLLMPWRFFRLWALADGVEPPENMVRCMANNYSPLAFWRAWHRSFNLWTTRYVYVPLGGATRRVPATLLVFTFVALWHDLSLRLLAWGWLISLFVIPELAIQYLFPPAQYGDRTWWRHACAAGAVANILMMMAANLVGFVLGSDGTKYLLAQLIGTTAGWQFLAVACGVIFMVVQLMFEYREEEKRQGIYRRF